MEYQWLENLADPKALAWVLEQNDKTLKGMKSFPSFDLFYKEALALNSSLGRLPYRYISAGYFYDLQSSEEKPLGTWCRCDIAEFEKENPCWESLLDFDELSKRLGDEWNYGFSIHSPSGDKVLVSLSHRGKDRHWVREFDLQTKKFVENGFEIPLSKSTVAWVDDDTLIVGGESPEKVNSNGFAKTLCLWQRGIVEKPIVFLGNDSDDGVWCESRKKGDDFAFINRQIDGDHAEISLFSLKTGLKRLNLPAFATEVMCFGNDLIFSIHQDEKGFIGGSILRVNIQDAFAAEAPTFEVLWTPTKGKVGKTFFRHQDKLVVLYLENVFTRFEYLEFANGKWKSFPQYLPKGLDISDFDHDPVKGNTYFRLESFTMAPALYKWEPGKIDKIKFLSPQFLGEYDTEQRWSTSQDGTQIPYFIVCRKDLKIDGQTPTLLSGYGGFCDAKTPVYSPMIGKLWLEKGGIYVLANIRGGGEFGPAWHLSARKENKQRSYDDFIAVAEDLISRKQTNPSHLAIYGRSNGGLLVGAVAIQRPELFAAVLCVVPLLDMIRYVEHPPGAIWISEFGDPKDLAMKDLILKYSPYHNIVPEKDYPKIFFMTSLTDDRVHPSHARKMAAKMQAMDKDCFLYEEASGGHKGGNNQVAALDNALKFAYLWKQVCGSVVM